MSGFFDGVYSFMLNWEDTRSALVKTYRMTYYEKKGSKAEIELYDVKSKRVFLKRMPYDLRTDQLFVGAYITIYARQMQVVEYGDPRTQAKFSSITTLALICQFGRSSAPALQEICRRFNFQNIKLMTFNATEASAFSNIVKGGPGPILTSGAVLAMELRSRTGLDCTEEWHSMIPSLQSKYDGTFWGASKAVEEKASRAVFSSPSSGLCTSGQNCSICLVKPHCVADGNLGGVVTDILSRGLAITGIRLCTLTQKQALEFHQVYETVLPDKTFTDVIQEASAGPSVAIEVSGEEVVQRLRAIAGPIDFPMAHKLRPTSLRAKYGRSTAQSAVHVTDLPEDGTLESDYLFRILTGMS